MNTLVFEFEILDPEHPKAVVPQPQLLVFKLDMKTVKVIVYFMENRAIHIRRGIATSGMGTITLGYLGESLSGTVTSSINLKKIAYTFTDAQGIARNFIFKGNLGNPEAT